MGASLTTVATNNVIKFFKKILNEQLVAELEAEKKINGPHT